MALVSNGWQISVALTDLGANVSKVTFYGPFATAAEAETGRAALATALNAVTKSLISQMVVSEVFLEDTAVVGTGENENQAIVVCRLDPIANGKTVNVRIINPEDTLFVAASGAGYNEIDPNDAALLAYLELFTVTDGSFTLSDGESLADATIVKYGKRIHRGSRNG